MMMFKHDYTTTELAAARDFFNGRRARSITKEYNVDIWALAAEIRNREDASEFMAYVRDWRGDKE
jgi:hypothetical protein